MLTPAEVFELIPQKAPFVFIDRIVEVDGEHVVSEYTFRQDEFFYAGHFPNYPVTPGVILLEAMGQTAFALAIYLLGLETSPAEIRKLVMMFTESNVEFVRVDQGEEVDLADLGHRLDLAELEAEELHERAVLAVAHLLAVPDRRLRHAHALRDVRLRDGARDPVGIGVPAQGDEHVLALGDGQRVGEGLRARLRRGAVRGRQTPYRFIHHGANCGHGFSDKSRPWEGALLARAPRRSFTHGRCQGAQARERARERW